MLLNWKKVGLSAGRLIGAAAAVPATHRSANALNAILFMLFAPLIAIFVCRSPAGGPSVVAVPGVHEPFGLRSSKRGTDDNGFGKPIACNNLRSSKRLDRLKKSYTTET